ncbi:deoxyhypusine synthase [Halodesulfurarchaeum sp.]|uniref:deoxyhypusine synthase n=1 Tax=Halodesulfurarchaeum sp. TaxID=1980530 RepID=UPI001BC605DF|nr:deoxyhypusine synthase [Halodesulfurarchaeum sp.]
MSEDTKDNVVPGSDADLEGPDVRGYDFRGEFDVGDLLDSYATTGFQASAVSEAIDLIEQMREADATIYLTLTSNIVSSGLREVVAAMVREGLIDVLITTSGSITEDIIKSEKPFKMGEWEVDDIAMREEGINRLGNIFVPSDRYVWLESYLNDFFPDFFAEQKLRTPTAFSREIGKRLEDEDSVLVQAAENEVPVYCPALVDAEVGNFLYYYRQNEDPEVGIEILEDYDALIDEGLLAEETGLVVLGGGVPKHQAIMTNLFRGGADYAVYVSTGMEGDGSLSGAPPKEAVSWGKIKDGEKNHTLIEAEATLVLPLIVAGVLEDL